MSKEDYQYMNKDGTINGVKIEDGESNKPNDLLAYGRMGTSEDSLDQGNTPRSQKEWRSSRGKLF